MNWHEYWFSFVEAARQKSQDPSFKVGAVIVDDRNRLLCTGYNGLPRGIAFRPNYHERPDKYMWMVHAEQNAIFNAAAAGTRLEGSILYTVKHPCVECCKAIVQTGIRGVYYSEDYSSVEVAQFEPDNWRSKMYAAFDMLREAGISYELIK